MDMRNGIWMLPVAALCLVGFYYWIARRNFEDNARRDEAVDTTTRNRLLNDQNGLTGQHFHYGLYGVRHNGCEAIALHNIKVLLGIPTTLSETIWELQKARGMIGYGFFGSNPYRLGAVLNRRGIPNRRVGRGELTRPGVYILSYWRGRPWLSALHTVACCRWGGSCVAYNLYGNGRAYTLPPEGPREKLLCAYYLGPERGRYL